MCDVGLIPLSEVLDRLLDGLVIGPPAFALAANRKERARMTATRRKTPPTSGSGDVASTASLLKSTASEAWAGMLGTLPGTSQSSDRVLTLSAVMDRG